MFKLSTVELKENSNHLVEKQFILYARTAPLTNVFYQIFKQTLTYINPVDHMFDVIGVLSFCAYINSSVFYAVIIYNTYLKRNLFIFI